MTDASTEAIIRKIKDPDKLREFCLGYIAEQKALHLLAEEALAADLVRAALDAATDYLDWQGEEPAADELRDPEAVAAIVAQVVDEK